MHNSAQLRCFENGNDDFGVEAFWIGDAARAGYFVPLNGPLNGHPLVSTINKLRSANSLDESASSSITISDTMDPFVTLMSESNAFRSNKIVQPIFDSGMSMLPDIRSIELSHKADWVIIAECNRADPTSFHIAGMRDFDVIDQDFSILSYPSGILHKLTHLMIVYNIWLSWWCCV